MWPKGIWDFHFGGDNEPIRDIILRRGPLTAQIAIMAMIVAWLIGLPVGILSALRRNSKLDYVLRFIITIFIAVPNFWLALTFILFTVLVFSWRPPLDVHYLWTNPSMNLQMTAGPAIALGISLGAITARMTRATFLEVLREDYVRTATQRGLVNGWSCCAM